MNSVQQFLVKLTSKSGLQKEHRVNTSSEQAAKYICESLFPKLVVKSVSVAQ